MTDDERAIAARNLDRRVYLRTARVGYIAAPAMFFLPLLYPIIARDWSMAALVCMTAAFAVFVSACSFSAMANTGLDGRPGLHQAWAVPVALVVLVPGGIAAFAVYGLVISTTIEAFG